MEVLKSPGVVLVPFALKLLNCDLQEGSKHEVYSKAAQAILVFLGHFRAVHGCLH